MRDELLEFEDKTEELRDYIKARTKHSNAIKAIQDYNGNHLQEAQEYANSVESLTRQKLIEYNSVITTLYGYFESYIENLVSSYVESAVELSGGIGNSPDEIKKNHFEVTITSVSKGIDYGRLSVSDAEERIKRLSKSIRSRDSISINSNAFAFHTANVRVSQIRDLFVRIGLTDILSRVVKTKTFREWYISKYSENKLDNENPSDSLNKIDELIERRNDIAHGNNYSSLSYELMLEVVNEIKIIARSLFSALSGYIAEVLVEDAFYLGNPIDVFNDEIVCINSQNIAIREGDGVIVETGNSAKPFDMSRIISIEVNHNSRSFIPSDENVDVGLKISGSAKENYDIYHVNKELASPFFRPDLGDV